MAFKYRTLAAKLQADISSGSIPEKLPAEDDLAQQYHVSRQTVRKALDLLADQGLIEKHKGTASRVLRPKDRSGDLIAVVTSYIDDYIFPAVLSGIQNVLISAGYSTVLYATENRYAEERKILQDLLHRPVGGIIVEGSKTALPSPNLDLYQKLDRAGVPLVFLHATYSGLPNAVCVSDSNEAGGYMLTRHLISRGHTRIAGIFKSDDIQGQQRCAGFLNAMRDAGLPLPDGQICWYSTEERRYLLDYGHTALLDHFLQFYLRDCTAVICYNDEIANQLVKRLLAAGRRIPEDVAVVSFDNSAYSDLAPVRITSLSHGHQNPGSIAAKLMLQLLRGEKCQSEAVSWILVRKESS